MPMRNGEYGEDLDPIEVRILSLYAEGMWRKQIATKLSLSEGTIKKYEARIRKRLGATHTIQAMALASEEHNLLRRKVETVYICGCDYRDPHIQRYGVTVHSDGSITNKRYDRHGYEVCPIHGMRLRGWATVPRDRPPIGAMRGPAPKGDLGSEIPDRRDNRDPATVGKETLRERELGRNGRAEALSKPAPMVGPEGSVKPPPSV